MKLINILKHAMSDPEFKDKGADNPDLQNRKIASNALFERAMRNERKREIDLYKKYASDEFFKKGMHDVLMRTMDQMLKSGGEQPNA